jgi:hypothetical protein
MSSYKMNLSTGGDDSSGFMSKIKKTSQVSASESSSS